MTNSPVSPARPHIYAFSTKRLVLLSCIVVLLIALGLMLGIRIEREQQARATRSSAAPVAPGTSAAPSGSEKDPAKAVAPKIAPAITKPVAKPAAVKVVSKKAAPTKVAPIKKPAVVKAASNKVAPEKTKPAAKSASAKTVAAKPAAQRRGHYTVQVESSQDKNRANLQVETLKKNDFPAYLETADLGDKGRYYRVMVGPYQAKAQAKEAQNALARDSRFTNSLIRHIP